MLAAISPDLEITILHFNDIYHISDTTLLARFATVLKDVHILDSSSSHLVKTSAEGGRGESSRSSTTDSAVLRVFSGDVFSPSLEASVLRGDHMPDVLEVLHLDVGCYGNHDFDFGEARLQELSQRTNFPWVLTNAVRLTDQAPPGSTAASAIESKPRLLAQARDYVVKEVDGVRIGFFGLAGTPTSDWPSNCQHLPDCYILDPVTVAKATASRLRTTERCDFIIAVTHMRLAEDLSVSNATTAPAERVDLILGGHDHHVLRRDLSQNDPDPTIPWEGIDCIETLSTIDDHTGQIRIVKSGTDWRGLSIVTLRISGRHRREQPVLESISVRQIHDMTKLSTYDQIPRCPEMLRVLARTHARIQKVVEQPLLYTDVALEGRSSVIRSRETNLGNMLADAVRAFYGTDIAFINSGAVRCDRLIPSSSDDCHRAPLRIRDAVDINPFGNAIVVKRVRGANIAEAMENSVGDMHTDGRFLHCAGMLFAVDWLQPSGKRISRLTTYEREQKQLLDHHKLYTVAMVDFIASGFDGYNCFKQAETIIGAEGAITDTELLLEIFGCAPLSSSGTPSITRKGDRQRSKNRSVNGDDQHDMGILRARAAVIRRYHEIDGLPVVCPTTEGRIEVIDGETQLASTKA